MRGYIKKWHLYDEETNDGEYFYHCRRCDYIVGKENLFAISTNGANHTIEPKQTITYNYCPNCGLNLRRKK